MLDPDRWGNGFATEAGRASVQWAFAHHDVAHVFSVILPENAPSAAVAERPGDAAWFLAEARGEISLGRATGSTPVLGS